MMDQAKLTGWSVEQRRALVAGVRDLVADEPGPRAQDALALAQEVLGPWPEQGQPEDFAVFCGSPWAEVALVALMVTACLKSDGLSVADAERVSAYAAVMGTDRVWTQALRHAARGRGHRISMALARRAPDGRRLLQDAWRQRGPLVVIDIIRSMTGRTKADPVLAQRFAAFGQLPDGSVGRAFCTHLTERQIPLPGEPGGLLEAAIHHDLMHTLTGYDTDPAGECKVAGFYAGMLYPGWPAWILAVLTTFELGLRVGPSFTVPTRHAFDLRQVWAAAQRGYNANVRPLDEGWDYRPLMTMDLQEARQQLRL
ncbi:MAG: hypothetical protein AAGF11_05460 [Myxococcota bacterium]